MSLFSVMFDIAAKTATFDEAINGVQSKLDSLAAFAARTGVAIAEGFASYETVKELVASFDAAADSADKLYLAAQKAGESVETFSQLAFAAKSVGINVDSLSVAMKAMQVATSKGGDIFIELGLDWQKLEQLSPTQQFEAMAQAISNLKNPPIRRAQP